MPPERKRRPGGGGVEAAKENVCGGFVAQPAAEVQAYFPSPSITSRNIRTEADGLCWAVQRDAFGDGWELILPSSSVLAIFPEAGEA
jgi:hypothetical protein